MTDKPKTPSFERVLIVDDLSQDAYEVELKATKEDADALAKYLNIPAINALSGSASVKKTGSLIYVSGEVIAEMTRECVASLEELDESVNEQFSVTYTEEQPSTDLPEEMEADLDAPEPVENGELNIADVLLEQLVLAMDPHPRKEGVEAIPDPGAGASVSPFSVLASLQADKKKND